MQERVLRLLEFDKILAMLAGCCVSEPGKESALKLRPLTEAEGVRLLQDETQEAESYLAALEAHPVTAFSDAGAALKRSRVGAMLSMRELLDVAGVLRASRVLRRALASGNVIEGDVLSRQAAQLYEDHALEKHIHACIKSEDEMADNASPALFAIRRNIRRENARVREKLNDIVQSARAQKYLQEAIITIRGGRYVVPVKQENRSQVPGLIHDHSASGQTLFIEPMAVVEINNSIRQLQAEEEAEIDRILEELTGLVAPLSDDLSGNIDILVRMDVVFARAALSGRMRGVRPVMSEDGEIALKGARHPLIAKDKVVPIDIRLESGKFGLIITGPNTGGKTVTLKTVGLMAVMAQSGLHIGAALGAKLPVYDGVFADIGDEQSIEQSLSTFSSHMTNIVGILSRVTPDSLVLIDELGAGTDPSEGAALAMAILDGLREKGATVLATTHYGELKAFAMETPGLDNASMEFDMETLRPTFRVLMGVPGQSNALEISRRLGLDDALVQKARGYISREKLDFEATLSEARARLNEAGRELETAKQEREQATALLKEAGEKLEKAEAKREAMLNKAGENAREIVQDAKAETERVIKELRQAAASTREAALEKEIQTARDVLRAQEKKTYGFLEEREGALAPPPKDLKIGETVSLIGHNLRATVLTLPDAKGELLVQAGVMKLTMHVSRVRRETEPPPEPDAAVRREGLRIKALSNEIDVRGQTVEEAVMNIDRYLDDVVLTGLSEVSIIHGKGKGALRAGVHKNLSAHPHVKRFRLGNYGEGDAGVTVVELK
ncbi:MAG: endonuclease MutS2 [Christensenellales bacterium]|jgi:DNA mismatch repair protein MutS2